MRSRLLLALASSVFLASLPAQEATAPDLERLQQDYEARLETIQKPIAELQDLYDAQLTKLQEELQSEGKLAELLLVKAERDSFRDASADEAEKNEDEPRGLVNLRLVYTSSLEKLERQIAPEVRALQKTFLDHLLKLKEQLTREGKLDDALAVSNLAADLQKSLVEIDEPKVVSDPFLAADQGETLFWELVPGADYKVVNDCQVNLQGEDFILTSPRRDMTWVHSPESLKPPFRVVTRAQTDGRGIRLYWGPANLVNFNWESNPSALRIRDPNAQEPTLSVKDEGSLDPNVDYEIELRVTSRSVAVYVDGRKRGDRTGSWGDVNTPVGIGPSFGSKVTVKAFRVFQEQ